MTTQLALGGSGRIAARAARDPARGAAEAGLRGARAVDARRPASGPPEAPGRASGRSAATRCRQAAHGDWSGTSTAQYPWGTVASTEQMTYDVADAHPESARTSPATPTTTITLPDRTLSWKAHLEVTSDATELSLQVEARAAQGRRAHPRKDVGGDDSAGQSVASREASMPITYRIDRERGRIYTTCAGNVTLPEVVAHFDALAARSRSAAQPLRAPRLHRHDVRCPKQPQLQAAAAAGRPGRGDRLRGLRHRRRPRRPSVAWPACSRLWPAAISPRSGSSASAARPRSGWTLQAGVRSSNVTLL